MRRTWVLCLDPPSCVTPAWTPWQLSMTSATKGRWWSFSSRMKISFSEDTDQKGILFLRIFLWNSLMLSDQFLCKDLWWNQYDGTFLLHLYYVWRNLCITFVMHPFFPLPMDPMINPQCFPSRWRGWIMYLKLACLSPHFCRGLLKHGWTRSGAVSSFPVAL